MSTPSNHPTLEPPGGPCYPPRKANGARVLGGDGEPRRRILVPDLTMDSDPLARFKARIRATQGKRWAAAEQPLPSEAIEILRKLFEGRPDEVLQIVRKMLHSMRVPALTRKDIAQWHAEDERWQAARLVALTLTSAMDRGEGGMTTLGRLRTMGVEDDLFDDALASSKAIMTCAEKELPVPPRQLPSEWAWEQEDNATCFLSRPPGKSKLGNPILQNGVFLLAKIWTVTGGKYGKPFWHQVAVMMKAARIAPPLASDWTWKAVEQLYTRAKKIRTTQNHPRIPK